MVKRRVLVTGSRTWTDRAAIVLAILNTEIKPGQGIVIVHGACRTGADRIADRFVAELVGSGTKSISAEPHPADWKKHGRAAGPIRNREMVESLDPERDLVLAFWDGASKGTLGTIELARDRGVAVRVYRPDGTSY